MAESTEAIDNEIHFLSGVTAGVEAVLGGDPDAVDRHVSVTLVLAEIGALNPVGDRETAP